MSLAALKRSDRHAFAEPNADQQEAIERFSMISTRVISRPPDSGKAVLIRTLLEETDDGVFKDVHLPPPAKRARTRYDMRVLNEALLEAFMDAPLRQFPTDILCNMMKCKFPDVNFKSADVQATISVLAKERKVRRVLVDDRERWQLRMDFSS